MKNYWKVGDYAKELKWEKSSLYFRVVKVTEIKYTGGVFNWSVLVDGAGVEHPSYMCEKTTKEKYIIGQY